MMIINSYPDTSGVVRVDVSGVFPGFLSHKFPLVISYRLYEQCRDAGFAIKLWQDPK